MSDAGSIHIPCIGSMNRHFLNKLAPNNMVIMKSARNIKNKIFAIEAAPSAIPPKPKMAAMIAITKKITDHRNISDYFYSY